jgi:ubiquinol-cytochrome c reductase cytochrome b subunit
VFLVVLHIFFLHETGSSNPIGVSSSTYKVPFHYYFSSKDVLGFIIYLYLFMVVSLTLGYYFIDAENFIPANALVTPVHIQPEWYFLFAYAILRSIPNKLGGVVALLISILVLFVFPFLSSKLAGGFVFRPLLRVVFWSFVFNFFILT